MNDRSGIADVKRDSSDTRVLPHDFSIRLRALRARLGLTQVKLAELLGVSFASVNRWEKGQARPSALAWQRIHAAELSGLEALTAGSSSPFAVAEPGARYSTRPTESPRLDFAGDPRLVQLVAEAERLSYGHLFNPGFAIETSLIDPLPHQRIAVYEQMLGQPRLRFLLADDAGAGKTIMAGLYIREMLSRRLIKRVLIVPPAGLVGNWRREMHLLFHLPFQIVQGPEARFGNPFLGPDGDLVIVSVDTLGGSRMFNRLQEPSILPYDLVIFDEAHKLSASREPDGTFRPTDRYRLAEALVGMRHDDPRFSLRWTAQHLLLLTATPHMGKDFPYFCLWRLLDPEVFSTEDAFAAYPPEGKHRHFLRRTKEEMVYLDGTRIYPTRISDTLDHGLSQGEISEQALYDRTTRYINVYYNRARILNRSAARLAMSVFQRRLTSSSYALMRSMEKRLIKLDGLIDDIRSGRLTEQELVARQRALHAVDYLAEATADEEEPEDGREANEAGEARTLGGVVANSLAELVTEHDEVIEILDLARRVHAAGDESKFDRLREILRDPRYGGEKILVFTEYRDTLDFLVRRLEGLGFTGKVARIHGGMDFREREQQVEFFRRSEQEGGATYLVATDAAGEGINLQFCWLMINYDIPWNPARLEQRMGRIHRYKQKHDPVVILNLVARRTREGRVLATLLEKLERIREELGTDKVFDVVGRLLEGVSIRDYMAQLGGDEDVGEVCKKLEGALTPEQVRAQGEWERRVYGDGGDVKARLADQKRRMAIEELRRLLPGYVRGFIEKAAPRLDITVEGDLDGTFCFRPRRAFALDPLWPALESYTPDQRERLTVHQPDDPMSDVFLHPGEPVFERLRSLAIERFGPVAARGAVFADPYAVQPYLFHLAELTVVRSSDATCRVLSDEQLLESRLIGLRQQEDGPIEPCPVEHLLLLKGVDGVPMAAGRLARAGETALELARVHVVERVTADMVEEHRKEFLSRLPDRESLINRGYDYQDATLAARRAALGEKARAGDPGAAAELARVKAQQRELASRREDSFMALRREPELVAAGRVRFVAHALVVPTADPEDRRRHDREVEAIAVRVVRAYEEAAGAGVRDVSTPPLARAAGLTEHPGFDLLSQRPGGEERAIEVKGRAGTGDIELTENEWAKSCNLREKYWLYVVFDCASTAPRLMRVRDPFHALLSKAKGGVVIEENQIAEAAARAGEDR